jgi:hypothetical protein
MRARTFFYVSAAILMLVISYSVGAHRANAQSGTPSATAQRAAGGRYQIVNGTPEMTRNIMLLDTEMGRTWIICTLGDSSTGWCPMSVAGTPSKR